MYRFCLAFLFSFLFYQFTANAQNELVLEKVSVNTDEIVLTWQYHFADSVTIYKCAAYCNKPAIAQFAPVAKVIMDSAHLQWTDLGADVTLRHDYRIGWGSSGMTPVQCNMVLKTGIPTDSCFNSVLLSWNPYINMMDTLDRYNIFYRKKDAGAFLLFDSIQGSHFTDIDPNKKIQYKLQYLDNETIYEFVIQAISKNDTTISYSNVVEYETGFVNTTPDIVNITCVTVVDDKFIEINVNTDCFFEKLYLLRDKSAKEVLDINELSFTIIDSITGYNSTNQYSFTDKNVSPKTELYYYRAMVSHKCKVSDTSNVLTNILLSGSRAEKYGDSIRFIQVGIPPINALKWYELYRIVFGEEHLITNTLTLKKNSYYIDIKDYMEDGAVMVYRIKSENGCYSNTVTIDHEPFIEFPNAFYPDGSDIVNQTFYPILKFPSEENYLFIIYNRWGQELYRSILPPVYGNYQNLQGRWDGTFQGKNCPPGFYAYQIKYTFNAGEGKYSNSGTFMLVR
jgi:hypothetical protein